MYDVHNSKKTSNKILAFLCIYVWKGIRVGFIGAHTPLTIGLNPRTSSVRKMVKHT